MNQTAFTMSELHGKTHRNTGCDWTAIWNACCGPVFRVLDEEGNNVADGQVRHFTGKFWLYVDETDGYQVMDESDMGHLILTNDE